MLYPRNSEDKKSKKYAMSESSEEDAEDTFFEPEKTEPTEDEIIERRRKERMAILAKFQEDSLFLSLVLLVNLLRLPTLTLLLFDQLFSQKPAIRQTLHLFLHLGLPLP